MNILYQFKHKTAYSDLEFLEIHLRVFLKLFEFFLKKMAKICVNPVWIEAKELKFGMNKLYYEGFKI
jgi:hypothetical protein